MIQGFDATSLDERLIQVRNDATNLDERLIQVVKHCVEVDGVGSDEHPGPQASQQVRPEPG